MLGASGWILMGQGRSMTMKCGELRENLSSQGTSTQTIGLWMLDFDHNGLNGCIRYRRASSIHDDVSGPTTYC